MVWCLELVYNRVYKWWMESEKNEDFFYLLWLFRLYYRINDGYIFLWMDKRIWFIYYNRKIIYIIGNKRSGWSSEIDCNEWLKVCCIVSSWINGFFMFYIKFFF